MPDTIHDDAIAFHLEKHPIIADTQPIFWRKVGQSFHITFEILRQATNFLDDSLRNIWLQRIEVFDRLGFELDLVFHNYRLRSSFRRSHGSSLLYLQLDVQVAELFRLDGAG